MVKKFFREGFIRELKNLEAAECYTAVMRVANDYSIGEGYALECFNELQTYREDIKFVKDLNAPHPLTEVIRRKTVMRKDCLLSLRSKIFASSKSLIESERKAGMKLLDWLRFNFEDKLYQASITHHSNSVRNMVHDLSLRPDLREAVELTAIQPTIDVIVQITHEIDNHLDARTRERSALVKKASLIRDEVYQLLKKFFRILEVEMMMERNRQGFYTQLSHILRQTLEYYRTPYIARTTRYRNAAVKAEAEAERANREAALAKETHTKVAPALQSTSVEQSEGEEMKIRAWPKEATITEKKQSAIAQPAPTIGKHIERKEVAVAPASDAHSRNRKPSNSPTHPHKEHRHITPTKAIKKRLKLQLER